MRIGDDTVSTFAQNLKRLRKQKGFSQAQLASLLHYGSTAIANYEAGRNEPSFDTLIQLAHFLDTTTDELLGVSITSQEQQLLSDYKKLRPGEQKLIAALAKALKMTDSVILLIRFHFPFSVQSLF